MSFPTSPTNGQTTVLNNITYQYNSTLGAWTRVLATSFGNLTVVANVSAGNITLTGNIVGGGVRSTTSATAPTNPTVGDMWYRTTKDRKSTRLNSSH